MDKLINQLLDAPKMISDKLPWNNWNSTIEESEDSIAGWIGKLFNVLAFAVLVLFLWGILNPLWNGGFEYLEGMDIVGMLLGMVFWAYAAFPISNVIRNVGKSLADSKSNIINLMFLDLPVAAIKTAGYVLAMIGLFAAIASVFAFVTTISLGGDLGSMLEGLRDAANIGTAALFQAVNDTPLEGLREFEGILNPDLPGLGKAWTMAGAMGVFGAFVGVLFTLINLYVNVVIYKFIFGLLSTLVNWVKGPYLPFRSL